MSKKIEASAQSVIIAQLDARKAYQIDREEYAKSMQNTLTRCARYASVVACDALAAAEVDLTFINRSVKADARFNVYAIVKVLEDAAALAHSVQNMNVYNKHIVRTMSRFAKAKVAFTRDDAKYACSSKYEHRDAEKRALIDFCAKDYDASTVNTQCSSSLEALKTMNVIVEVSKDTYQLASNAHSKQFVKNCNA